MTRARAQRRKPAAPPSTATQGLDSRAALTAADEPPTATDPTKGNGR